MVAVALPRPGCTNNTCGGITDNPYWEFALSLWLGEDNALFFSTDGQKFPSQVPLRDFSSSCVDVDALEGLANVTKGMAGLGRSITSLHAQATRKLKLSDKFALCIPSVPTTSESGHGAMFFGGAPYFDPDLSEKLQFTPLIVNPVGTGSVISSGVPSIEYFIGVTSIRVDDRTIPLDSSLLSIDKEGDGGTKLSTTTPYTVLHTSIHIQFVKAFVKAAKARNIGRVSSVAPFKACFNSKTIHISSTGPVVPTIDLVLQSDKVLWRIIGPNSMVDVSKDVMCLGFVDGGKKPRTAIVLGGHQLQDNLLEFDLTKSPSAILGFSSSLWVWKTTCARFRDSALSAA